MSLESDAMPKELLEEAKCTPNGWVYQIEGDFGPEDAIPKEAIVGAWKVDEHGNITGAMVPNPNFRKAVGRK
jgi:hypothetical protein